MGCAASKVKKAEDVSRCRARRRLMKQAVASRHQFAAAHAAYIQAMKNVGAAFRQFGETEMRVDSAAAAAGDHKSTLRSPDRPLPPPPPPVFLHDDSSPHIEFLSPPASPTKREQEQDGAAAAGGDEEHEHEHYEDAKADSMRKDGFYSKKHEEEEEDHQRSSSVFYYHDREANAAASNKDYYYAAAAAPPPPPVPSSTAPPPPSPPRTSAWDFLDPFRPPEPPMHLQEQRRLKKMEQQIHHQQEQEDQEDEDDEDEEDGDDQDEEEHLVRKSNKNHHQQHPSSGSVKRDLAIIVLPAGGIGRKELVEVAKEVDELFLRAYECGKDVSKLLEARKVHYHSNFVDSKGYESHSKRVLQAISLGHRTSSKSPLKVVASEDHLSSPDEAGTAGSHAGTLDKLLAWEKKLYEEVKNTEQIRAEFRKKCSSVKSIDLKEEVSETTKTLIKMLSTKVQVSLQGVDTAITAINKLKEDELYTQLVQLIEGLMNMWNELYDCHQRQHRIVAEMKAVDHWGSVEPTTNIHRVATSQLELALQAWFLSFNKLLAAHRDYLHNLTGWLRLSNMELEMETACRESGSSQAVMKLQDQDQDRQQRVSKQTSGKPKSSSSSSSRLTSSMLQLCQDWSLALDRLPDKVASESIKSFQVVMHKLVELQSEEVKHRKRVDALSKEVDRKASYFTGSKGKKQKTKMMMMMQQQQQQQLQKQEQEPEDQQAASSNPAPADSTDKQEHQHQQQQQEDDFYMNIPSILKNSTKRKDPAASSSSSRFFAAETRLNALNSLRAKLEEEKEKVSKVVFDTRAMSINSLHTGLPSIFQAVAGFGRICLHAYQSLYCQAHNGAILRITEG